MAKEKPWWNRFWRDKQGKVVVWQNPNLPLWSWLIAMLLTHVLPYGQLNFMANLVAFGSLFTWCYLEIRYGDSYCRRLLGAIVLIWSIHGRL